MVRSLFCDKTGLKKGTWTPEEDRKLKDYITRYGSWNWRQIPRFAGLSRCGKSCRLRWLNYLRPNIKRGDFSKEENDIIMNLHESLGNRWSAIAAQLSGRTDNEIKNHWHAYIKKRSRQVSISQEDQKPSSTDHPRKRNQEQKISKAKKSSVKPWTQQTIIESSQIQFSSVPPSSTELFSLTIDNAAMNSSSIVAESDSSPSEWSAETTASFWTEPFFADNYETTYQVDTGFLSPHSPIIGQEFLCSYGLYDEDNNNVLNW